MRRVGQADGSGPKARLPLDGELNTLRLHPSASSPDFRPNSDKGNQRRHSGDEAIERPQACRRRAKTNFHFDLTIGSCAKRRGGLESDLNPDIRERNVGAFDRKAQQRAVETPTGLAGVSNKERRGQIGAFRPIYFDDAVHGASPTAKRCLELIFHREALEGNSLCVRTRPSLSISATVFILRIGAEKGRVSWKFTTSASCAAKRAPIAKRQTAGRPSRRFCLFRGLSAPLAQKAPLPIGFSVDSISLSPAAYQPGEGALRHGSV